MLMEKNYEGCKYLLHFNTRHIQIGLPVRVILFKIKD